MEQPNIGLFREVCNPFDRYRIAPSLSYYFTPLVEPWQLPDPRRYYGIEHSRIRGEPYGVTEKAYPRDDRTVVVTSLDQFSYLRALGQDPAIDCVYLTFTSGQIRDEFARFICGYPAFVSKFVVEQMGTRRARHPYGDEVEK